MSLNYGNEISVNGINCLYRFSDNFHDHTFPLCPSNTFGSFGSPRRRRRTCQEGGSARRRSRTGTGRSAYLGTRPRSRAQKERRCCTGCTRSRKDREASRQAHNGQSQARDQDGSQDHRQGLQDGDQGREEESSAQGHPQGSPKSSSESRSQGRQGKQEPKAKKPKLVRDSFTFPKDEYVVIDALKLRGAKLSQPAKKSELLRAGLKLLASLGDQELLAALRAVPAIKTGRPRS